MNIEILASKIGATIHNPSGIDVSSVEINKVSPIDSATKGDLTFISRAEYLKYLSKTEASSVILREPNQDIAIVQLIHKNPQLAYAKASNVFYQYDFGAFEIDENTSIHSTAKLASKVKVFAHVTVEENSTIGEHSVLYSGVHIGKNVSIGKNVILHANVVIYDDCVIEDDVIIHAGAVIGADGFGYVGDGKELIKIPQTGNVLICQKAEIGALSTVDRAAMGTTVIGKNSKLDSKVHIGHNVVIGENCVFSAHTAIAGSTKIGNWVQCGGHSGVAGHLEVCDFVNIGAMTGVIKSISKPGTYLGFPAVEASSFHRRQVHFKRFSDQAKKIVELEERLKKLESSQS